MYLPGIPEGIPGFGGIPGCKPCDPGCKKGPVACPMSCMPGCGCPPGLVSSPTIENKCIKPEECPEIPEGRFCP